MAAGTETNERLEACFGAAPDESWAEYDVIEPCRKCAGRVRVTYYMDADLVDYDGWAVSPLQPCGDPDRCGEKVCGLDPDEDAPAALADMPEATHV